MVDGEWIMQDRADLAAALKVEAGRLGFNMVGIVPAAPARRLDAYLAWLDHEYHGQMGYMARADRVARRRDLHLILPDVRTIICVGLDYETFKLPAAIAEAPDRGRISNYAWGADYHEVMTPRLQALAAWLGQQTGGQTTHKVYVDTGAILERDHAESAGLGFTGKNTMLIGPRRGSWFFLGELLTTAALPPDAPNQPQPTCGSCRRCLTACPTTAFPAPYVLDARRCISYLTIELKGWIPRELRPMMGNWVYGCDVCQAVCPFNRFAPTAAEAAFRPDSLEQAAPRLLDLLALDEAGFAQRFANSAVRRIRRARLVRNACVAAGNWGSVAALPALSHLLHDPEPLVRGHAAWALGRMGGQEAQTRLRAALAGEGDGEVRGEMAAALGGEGREIING